MGDASGSKTMSDEQGNLMKYFMDQSNERFDKIEAKLDQLMSMRAQILLIAATASSLVSVIVSHFLKK